MTPASDSSKRSNEVQSSKKKHGASADGWAHAVALCEKYVSRPDQKADALLNDLSRDISSEDRRRCQRLFYGAIRHERLINHLLDTLIAKPPRPQLRAMLSIALAEWLENVSVGASIPPEKKGDKAEGGQPSANFFPGMEKDESLPKIVDFTVGRAKRALSPGEGKLVNAVLRRAASLAEEIAESGSLGLKTSHPDWLVRRWIAERGSYWTEKTLLLNQKPAEPFFHWLAPIDDGLPVGWVGVHKTQLIHGAGIECRDGLSLASLEHKSAPHFFHLTSGAKWADALEALNAGKAYAQDPATWLAAALADVQPGEGVLDLCAAPGGKASYLIEALGDDPKGALVALDQPGPRIEQLDENLRRWAINDEGPEVHLVALDLLEAQADELGAFNAVLLDAPCSNTGVIRRRPDIKHRLKLENLAEYAELQLKLLTKAAAFVAEGGRLIYSTCSLEPEENADVVERFLEAYPEWEIAASAESTPADTGFDGACVFRLERS